jgi:hypothetical protein
MATGTNADKPYRDLSFLSKRKLDSRFSDLMPNHVCDLLVNPANEGTDIEFEVVKSTFHNGLIKDVRVCRSE